MSENCENVKIRCWNLALKKGWIVMEEQKALRIVQQIRLNFRNELVKLTTKGGLDDATVKKKAPEPLMLIKSFPTRLF